MSTSDGMAARRTVKQTSPQSQAAPQQTKALPRPKVDKDRSANIRASGRSSTIQDDDTQMVHIAFSLEFTYVTLARVQQMAKKAKRLCTEVKRRLVILPAKMRPRRAALLAASQKAEKYRQSWETLAKLISSQGEGMVQETLAAMRQTEITEDTLVAIVHELCNRFPSPVGDEEYMYEGAGQAANSMGPLYATASPAMPTSPMRGSPMNRGMNVHEDTDESSDSDDDFGMRLP